MPFDAGGEGGEGFGARGEVGVHGFEGVDGGAFDDVEDGVGEKGGAEESVVGGLCDDCAAEAVAYQDDVRECGQFQVGFDGVDDKC